MTGGFPAPAGGGRHVAARPIWRCRACGAPWPCQPAKLHLRREYAHDPAGLATYLCLLMHDAINDDLQLRPGRLGPAEYYPRPFTAAVILDVQRVGRYGEVPAT
ncbi:hypothetical protein [Micromonospora halophytica]|uniref:Flavin reductase n=1 Tax=Micromonospora halophytica TaxID=47864 RepID=A0A1C5II38_9ACTN|nr:hypothetical protein [Micromonospora halophytica]SCG58027.1 hypothetical protein GA0070560_111176 [Micromonospora halophytica]